jgi:hypothetical protein
MAINQLTEALARVLETAAKLDTDRIERFTNDIERVRYDYEHSVTEQLAGGWLWIEH